MIIRANIKYSVNYQSWRIYKSNVVLKEHGISNIIYLDENMNRLPDEEHDFNKVSFILKYFYSNFDSLKDNLNFTKSDLSIYLFIPVTGYKDFIRVINMKISDKLNVCSYLKELSYEDIASVYRSLSSQ